MVYAVASGVALLEKATPQSHREAMASADATKWRAAEKAEFDGCVAAKTWELVRRESLPAGTNVIRVKWVYKVKTDETGAVTKYKARITPKGFMQRHGVDYFEVYASTGMYKTLRVMLALVAAYDMELWQFDVPQAFTQAPLDEDVYMEMPEGFEVAGMVCRLLMSLYGLKQSPRNWWLLVSAFLVDVLGFTACVSDPCLFWKKSRTGRLIVLFLFVDDMQVAFCRLDLEELVEIRDALFKRFKVTDLGESKFMLGMRITRDRAARTLTLDQELYVSKALEKFGLDRCVSKATPGASKSETQAADSDQPTELDQPCDLKLYQEKVGTLLYAAISTRPDIAFAVNRLAQRMQAPTLRDAKACDRVFRYLAGTKTQGLLYGRQRSETADAAVTVSAYADADWGSDPVDRKSVTGWIAMINGDPVSWASKKQKTIAQSTCEAELYAEAAAINETKWLSGLLGELGVGEGYAPLIYGDNQSAQALSKNGIKSERTKHIAIKYAMIHDEVSHGRVELQWVPSSEQLADILTKSLARPLHEQLRDQLMTEVRPPASRLVGVEPNPGPSRRGDQTPAAPCHLLHLGSASSNSLLHQPPRTNPTPGHEGGGSAITDSTESVSSREGEASFATSLSRQVVNMEAESGRVHESVRGRTIGTSGGAAADVAYRHVDMRIRTRKEGYLGEERSSPREGGTREEHFDVSVEGFQPLKPQEPNATGTESRWNRRERLFTGVKTFSIGTGTHSRQTEACVQPRGLTPPVTTRLSAFTRPARSSRHAKVMFTGPGGTRGDGPAPPKGPSIRLAAVRGAARKCDSLCWPQAGRSSGRQGSVRRGKEHRECSRRSIPNFANIANFTNQTRIFEKGVANIANTQMEERLRRASGFPQW